MRLQTIRIFSFATAVCLAAPTLAQPQRDPEPQDPYTIRPTEPPLTESFEPIAQPQFQDSSRQPQFPDPRTRTWPVPAPGPREYQVDAQYIELLKARLAEANEQQAKNLPPLENGELHAYRLKYIDPTLLAETLESFLGTSHLRLVPDEANNVLLTYATKEVTQQISNLVTVLDAENKPIDATAFTEAEEMQSVQIRIFWLIDDDSTPIQYMEPTEYLPGSVLQAVKQLGLQSPRLVTQSSGSIYAEVDEGTGFNFNFPAIIHNETVQFRTQGELSFQRRPSHDLPMPMLAIEVSVHGATIPIELAGKLTAPLGHYMVLGTSNYVPGGSLAAMKRGRRGSRGGPMSGLPPGEGGAFGRGAYSASETFTASTKPTTSRFAFVVQVVEAKSFSPEE